MIRVRFFLLNLEKTHLKSPMKITKHFTFLTCPPQKNAPQFPNQNPICRRQGWTPKIPPNGTIRRRSAEVLGFKLIHKLKSASSYLENCIKQTSSPWGSPGSITKLAAGLTLWNVSIFISIPGPKFRRILSGELRCVLHMFAKKKSNHKSPLITLLPLHLKFTLTPDNKFILLCLTY